jgi:O-antigen ligase
MFKLFSLWGIKGFSNALFTSTPDSYFYSFAALNRLLLFFVFIYLLSIQKKARCYYHVLFIGGLIGGVGAAILGILNQCGVISLDWYQLWSFENRLQSIFGNPGWFAEYLCVVIPFILFGFFQKNKSWKIFLFFILIICEIAIILTGSRSSWLTYPLVLIFCWLFFYFFQAYNKKGVRWKNRSKIFIKVLISIPITILISIFIVLQVIEKPRTPIYSSGDTPKKLRLDHDYQTIIIERIANKRSFNIRKTLWIGGIALWTESPIFGMGYGSYGWHASIQRSIKKSKFYANRPYKFFDTPHNTFIQIVNSGGIIGFILWFSIIFYVVCILLINLKKERNLYNIPVILSIFSFFLFGFAQSMQYIAVIWFLIFLNIGYTMTLSTSVLSDKHKKFWKTWIGIGAVIVILGGVYYSLNFESQNLAGKYGLASYTRDQSINQYQGFYRLERGVFGPFRWSGKRGVIKHIGGGVVELKFICLHPDVEKKPVILSVYLNKEKIGFITFTKKGEKYCEYYLSNLKNDSLELLFEVSRTWNPKKHGVNMDTRNLGIGISPVKVIDRFPEKGIGFYSPEILKKGPKGWPHPDILKYRWTVKRASIEVKQNHKKEGITLLLRASHPDISKNKPVILEIYGNRRKIKELNVQDKWQKVFLSKDILEDVKVITFQVNRTWNPKSYGISSDDRDLGVAIVELN